MAGTLVKKNAPRAVLVPGGLGTPGSPGQPALPARQVSKKVNVCRWVDIRTGRIVDQYTRSEVTYYRYVCGDEEVIEYIPAQPYVAPTPPVPPTPQQWRSEMNIGWTGGAHTLAMMVGDGVYRFGVPSAVAAVVGLVGADSSTSPSEATHAFQILSGQYRISEAGVVRGPMGVHNVASEYGIRRRAGLVEYLVDGVPVYTSTVPSSGPVVLDATLYAPGDTVLYRGLDLLRDGASAAAMEPLESLGGDDYAQGVAKLGFFTAAGTSAEEWRVNVAMLPLEALGGDYDYGVSAGKLGCFTAAGESGWPEPAYAIAAVQMAVLQVAATGLSGTVGAAAVVMQPLAGLGAEQSYGASDASIGDAWIGYGTGGEPSGQVDMQELMFLQDESSTASVVVASFSSSFAMLAEVEAMSVTAASMLSQLTLSTSAELAAVFTAFFESGVAVGTQGSDVRFGPDGRDEPARTWVVNTQTNAMSEYEGFDFDQMWEESGQYYGARGAQVYRLGGNDDAGAPIDAHIGFGKQTFGTSALKHVPNFYVGMSSTGVLLLRVSTGCEVYTYRARSFDPRTHVQRYDLGKGLRASYYEFELFNQAGADFDIDSVEFVVLPTARRI